jgi:uncharacterized lipoprotein YmbA
MNLCPSWMARSLRPVVLAGVLAGCAASSPAPVLLMLPSEAAPMADAAAAPQAAASMPLIAVRRVAIPEYIVARRVRYRADPSTLAEWPNTYWAERVEIGVSHAFLAALRRELPGALLCDVSCGDHAPALTLQVDLMPLDFVRSSQKLVAHARIALSGAGAAPKVLQTLERDYAIPATADTAQAQAQAMATLIQQTAAAAAPLVRDAK